MTHVEDIASLEDVSLAFDGGIQALCDVTLNIRKGEWLCVLGANGSGKSTLAEVLAGLLAPDKGVVTLVGERVFANATPDTTAYSRARRHLGLVFQNPDDQIVTTVVEDDVAFGPENLGLSSVEIGKRVERELKRVALSDHAKDNPVRLSGGQKQRVAIAGALALEPDVLILDEPGALLDVRGREAIMRVAQRLKAAGTTIVHVTHFMDEALLADRVIVLDEGHIALEGTPREVFSQADVVNSLGLEMPRAARLAKLLGERGFELGSLVSDDELFEALSSLLTKGLGPAAKPANAAAVQASEALGTRDVTFSYHDGSSAQPAVLDVSCSVPKGTTCAIVGQTGSGKSTLVRMLCGLAMPDAGEIRIDGDAVHGRREWRKLRGHVGYVMQHPERQLFAETVAKDVAFGPTNLGLSKDEVALRVNKALDAVGLAGHENASPFELSGGQQRLCAIAGILAMNPKVLILDEPTAGLDPRGRSELRHIIDKLAARGITVVVVTHSMEDAARKDQVVVLDEGRVLAAGTPQDVFSPEHADKLRASGLGLPWPMECALKLRECGVDVGLPLTMEALADAIVAYGDNEAPGRNGMGGAAPSCEGGAYGP